MMTGPPWLPAIFAAFMIATSGYCLTRLAAFWRRRRPTDYQVDAMHVLMGVAMAGMLVPRLRVFWTGGWEIVFGVAAGIFIWRIIRAARRPAAMTHWPAHDVQHLLACAAMLYMLASLTGRSLVSAATGGMSGAAPSSTLGLILAVTLFWCVVRTADRISSLPQVAVLAATGPGVAATPADNAAGGSSRTSSDGANGNAEPSRLGRAAGGVPLSPQLAACCEIAMGVTMGYMLIVML
jgi:hypothetical protein